MRTEAPESPPAEPVAPPTPVPSWHRWLVFGLGVGIEVRETSLAVTIVRVRPRGISVLGSALVPNYTTRPATEWGAELQRFLKKIGAGHVAATVLLPRRDVVARVLNLPGVAPKDMEAAIAFQVDGLHPFPEDEAVWSFARLGKTGNVLVGITRQEVVAHYSTLFAEAGIKTASFTFSAAALYSATRLLTEGPQPAEFLAVRDAGGEFELYGESAARPVFTAAFDQLTPRALAMAVAELRLPPESEPLAFAEFLPKAKVFPADHDPASGEFAGHVLPYAAALLGAAPRFGADVNLLPLEQRRTTSRARLIPTVTLGVILTGLLIALALHARYEDSRYLMALQTEIKKLEPRARRSDALDRRIADTRMRTQLLTDFRRRSQADLDALNELTKILEPPAWTSSLELTRTVVQLSGDTDQAGPLLQKLDASPLFRDSEFTTPLGRVGQVEVFRIRTTREGNLGAPEAKK